MDPLLQVVMAICFAIPCFVMSVHLAKVWRDPMAMEEGAWVNRGMGIFIMEFILLHAGVFIGSAMAETSHMGVRLLVLLGLILFYGIFAAAISWAFKSRQILNSFLWLIGGRFVAIVIGVSEEKAELITMHSLYASMVYLAVVFATVFVPFPEFGITDSIARRFRLEGASGLWVDKPHRAIGGATIYYFLVGVMEIGLLSWIEPG
ncbi:MAG: hypothetical protein R3242_06795 [Akkermansiaceae bacterium]|nr:hypothetical protein [Akkermansiaceae bacterium]